MVYKQTETSKDEEKKWEFPNDDHFDDVAFDEEELVQIS